MTESLPRCLGCGFPLRPFQYAMQVCTDCVQRSQLREQQPAEKSPHYGFVQPQDEERWYG